MVKRMCIGIGGVFMLLMVAGCSGVMEAELLPVEDNGGDAIVVLHNLSKGKEGKYKVMVLYESEPIAYLPIENGKAVFEAHRMLPGSCYTFDIVTAKDSKSVGKVKWRNLEIWCMPESDESEDKDVDVEHSASATLSYNPAGNKNGTYTVTLQPQNMNGDISYEEFRLDSDGTECNDAAYVRRCVVIRSLQNDGFSNHQLRCLKPLIIEDYDYDKIRQLFNHGNSPDDIEKVVKQMRVGI